MSPLLESKIQELEQIRQNLCSNAGLVDETAEAYRKMALGLVEYFQKELRAILKAEFPEK